MSIYHQDASVTLLHGDALEQARTLPDGSVDCIVTSPPYFGLRDYGSEGQYGLESTLAGYVETIRALFKELQRVLANDGTLWINVGDTYRNKAQQLVPSRVAIALQEDGWILRNDIIWHKPDAMPHSVKDRMVSKHEHLFLFVKSSKYHFDLDPIRERAITADLDAPRLSYPAGSSSYLRGSEPMAKSGKSWGLPLHPAGKNPGDVWKMSHAKFKAAHFATFPRELPARAIKAGCKPGGTVLDPFSGSGTTGMVAKELGRKYVGIDISEEYLMLSLETRLQATEPRPFA